MRFTYLARTPLKSLICTEACVINSEQPLVTVDCLNSPSFFRPAETVRFLIESKEVILVEMPFITVIHIMQHQGPGLLSEIHVKSEFVNKNLLTWLLIGWLLWYQPIRCQVWKYLLTNMDFNMEISKLSRSLDVYTYTIEHRVVDREIIQFPSQPSFCVVLIDPGRCGNMLQMNSSPFCMTGLMTFFERRLRLVIRLRINLGQKLSLHDAYKWIHYCDRHNPRQHICCM